MRAIGVTLVRAGHTITSSWVGGWHDGVPERTSAIEDLHDLLDADCIVAFTEEPTEQVSWAARGGRHVEFGIAIAKGKRLCIIGPRENVFHHLPEVEQYATIEELVSGLADSMEVAS
jgi:hypothetical protein